MSPRPLSHSVAGIVAMAFGALTVVSGGLALFGGAQIQARVGDAVPFVLWFNFMAGFAYVLAGLGIWTGRRWALPLAALIAAGTLAVAAGFAIHALGGGAYETRTVGALALRFLVWAAISMLLWWAGRGHPAAG